MAKLLPKKRSHRIAVILVAIAVFMGAGLAGARWIAWPYFKSWREARANNVAREYFLKGDYPNALVAARKTLEYNRNNIEAAKLAVEITEKQESQQAFVYQQLLTSVQPTLENKLKLIRIAVKHRVYGQAAELIGKMGAEASQSAEFFDLASQVTQRLGQTTKAKYYLMSLVKLRPEDKKARLDLAQIRLLDGFTENKPTIRTEIRNLATEAPELRVRALTLLLGDAIDSKSDSEALALANDLVAVPDLSAMTRTTIAEAYRLFAPKRFTEYVQELQKSADTPEEVVVIVTYLANHDLADETRRWLDSLPNELKNIESVQVTYAYCLLKQEDFPAMEKFLKGCKWVDNEYARQALLAYRYRKQNDARSFTEAWQLAMIEVGNNPRKLQMLLAQVSAWNWPAERIELLWKKFNLNPADKVVRNQLTVWERSKNNTSNLNRLFARITEHEPSDLDYRNNYAYSCLLLGINLDRAHNDAREIRNANPKNAFYTTTYALSLYKQGKAQEALQAFESMGPAMMANPERVLLHSVLLIANGRVDEGVEQSAHLKLDQFLPEERRLLAETSSVVSKARREQDSIARLAATSNDPGANDRKSWLAALPAAFRKESVQLDLADSLYASDDFKGLESTLRSEKWDENDFLRQTLLAYAYRNQGKDGDARSAWRIALSAAGSRPANLSVLEEMTERWGWPQEHVEVLNKLFQRDALDTKIFTELVDHYSKTGQTAELARVYGLRIAEDASDAEAKTRFAYYSLLTGTNLTRAHSLARETFDAAPTNPFRAKVYAFSLLKQSRAADGWRLLEKFPDQTEVGAAQLNLLKAAIAVKQDESERAQALLKSFDSSSALPEEAALAEDLAKTLAKKNA